MECAGDVSLLIFAALLSPASHFHREIVVDALQKPDNSRFAFKIIIAVQNVLPLKKVTKAARLKQDQPRRGQN